MESHKSGKRGTQVDICFGRITPQDSKHSEGRGVGSSALHLTASFPFCADIQPFPTQLFQLAFFERGLITGEGGLNLKPEGLT